MVMTWTRQMALGVAPHDCKRCHGLGLRDGRLESTDPCDCVLHVIFRQCLERFREVVMQEPRIGATARRTSNGGVVWGREDEEYMADILSIAKRTLDEDQYRLFRFRYLLGADPERCAAKMGLDSGEFARLAGVVERKLGRAWAEAGLAR